MHIFEKFRVFWIYVTKTQVLIACGILCCILGSYLIRIYFVKVFDQRDLFRPTAGVSLRVRLLFMRILGQDFKRSYKVFLNIVFSKKGVSQITRFVSYSGRNLYLHIFIPSRCIWICFWVTNNFYNISTYAFLWS